MIMKFFVLISIFTMFCIVGGCSIGAVFAFTLGMVTGAGILFVLFTLLCRHCRHTALLNE